MSVPTKLIWKMTENLRVLTTTDMLSELSSLIFRSQLGKSNYILFDHIHKLKQFVENKNVQNFVQKKITVFKRIEHRHCRNFKRRIVLHYVGYKKT